MKINWKKVGKVILHIGERFFPILGLVEELSSFKDLASNEKQDLAFNTLRNQVVANLLPHEANKIINDPRFDIIVRSLIDNGVTLNNLIAEILVDD